jgi:hypothetical protein
MAPRTIKSLHAPYLKGAPSASASESKASSKVKNPRQNDIHRPDSCKHDFFGKPALPLGVSSFDQYPHGNTAISVVAFPVAGRLNHLFFS